MKALHPLGVDLHMIRLGQVPQLLLQQHDRRVGVAGARSYHKGMR